MDNTCPGPSEPLAQSTNNTWWKCLIERPGSNPSIILLDESALFNPITQEFLREKRIAFTMCIQQLAHSRTDSRSKKADRQCLNLFRRERTDRNFGEYSLTSQLCQSSFKYWV